MVEENVGSEVLWFRDVRDSSGAPIGAIMELPSREGASKTVDCMDGFDVMGEKLQVKLICKEIG